MTNESFIKCLDILQAAIKNADSEVMSQLTEYAKKLVAVVEAAKEAVGYDNAELLVKPLDDLERE